MTVDEIKADLMTNPSFRNDLLGELSYEHPELFIDMIHGNEIAREMIQLQYEQLLEQWANLAIERGEYDSAG